MTMLANRTEQGNPALPGGAVLTLADYEARIHLYREQIGVSFIGIGRTLLEAKAAKVVPHGQWEDWVARNTGLTPRQAQRLMQAAAEIKDGSAMARLEISKALLLLSSGLDAEQQEEIAGRAVEEGATVRDLREQLKQAKLKLVQETGAAAEIRDALKKAEEERDQLETQMRATERAYRDRLDEAREDAYKRGEMAGGADAAAKLRELEKNKKALIDELKKSGEREHQAREDLARTSRAYERQKNRIDYLNEKLQEAESKPAAVPADYARDREMLMAAAEDAERRAADAEAELEALRAAGAGQPDPAWKVLKKALDIFMADCELLPINDVQGLLREEQKVGRYLDYLEAWIRATRGAMSSAVEGEGAVE